MTDRQPTKPFSFLRETMQHPGPRNYLFFAVGCLLLNFLLMANNGLDLIAFFAVLLATPGLIARKIVAPYIYLLFVGYQLFDPGLSAFYNRYVRFSLGRAVMPTLEQVLLALGVLGYFMAQLRLLAFWRTILPPRFRNRGADLERTEGTLNRNLADCSEPESFAFLVRVVLCGIVAAILLVLFDGAAYYLEREAKVPLTAPLIGFISFVAAVAVCLLGFRLMCTILEARRITKEEAYLTLADTLWRETRREQQRLYRWRKWHEDRTVQKGGMGS